VIGQASEDTMFKLCIKLVMIAACTGKSAMTGIVKVHIALNVDYKYLKLMFSFFFVKCTVRSDSDIQFIDESNMSVPKKCGIFI